MYSAPYLTLTAGDKGIKCPSASPKQCEQGPSGAPPLATMAILSAPFATVHRWLHGLSPPHRSCSCYAVLRCLGFASPPSTYGRDNTVNNLAMGLSKDPRFSKTSVPPGEKRRSPRHMEETTLATNKGTPLPLFVQILRVCLHGIHPTEDTSCLLLLDTRCS